MQVAAHGPGRVNLIGEHTDYNDGLCLAFAIERGVTVRAEATFDGRVFAHTSSLGEDDVFAADSPAAPVTATGARSSGAWWPSSVPRG